MTAPTRAVRRRPHPLVTLAGWAVFLLILGGAAWVLGFCVGWVSDVVFGVKP